MDAATAAAMSDPDRDPKFRRRWHDTQRPAQPGPPAEPRRDTFELTGRELLEERRRERARRDAGAT